MSDDLVKLWVYLAADPLLWLTLTLVAYQGGLWLHRRYGGNPLLNRWGRRHHGFILLGSRRETAPW